MSKSESNNKNKLCTRKRRSVSASVNRACWRSQRSAERRKSMRDSSASATMSASKSHVRCIPVMLYHEVRRLIQAMIQKFRNQNLKTPSTSPNLVLVPVATVSFIFSGASTAMESALSFGLLLGVLVINRISRHRWRFHVIDCICD